MANQKLIEFIRTFRKRGYSTGQLYKHLVGLGYNPDEVKEALGVINNAPKKSLPVLPMIYVAIMGVIIASVFLLLLNDQNKTADCGGDIECFTKASKKCRTATAEHIINKKTPYLSIISVFSYEIKGTENETCIFTMELESSEASFHEEYLQTDNNTKISLEEKIIEINSRYQNITGLNLTCAFTDLSEKTRKWQDNNFEEADFSDCSGDLLREINTLLLD